MASHKVTITRIPRMLVGANDIVFEVREGETKLGDLRVSQGNLFWVPSGFIYGYVVDWAKFNEIAQGHGRRRKYTY